jgi:hypothetical protein
MWQQDDPSNKRMKWEEDQFDWGEDQNRQSDKPETRQGDAEPMLDEDPHAYSTAKTDERNMAMLCHLAAFSAFFVPLGNVLGPLLVWSIKKKEMPFVDYHGKEALNFQISLSMYMIVSAILAFVIIGIPMLAVGFIAGLVMPIIAGLKANEGVFYRYPAIVRFIK